MQIIPYLIAMLIAISVFRTTGCMNYVIDAIRAAVNALGLNSDFVAALPVGLMKTLSGSGARGLMVDVMTTYGVDSFQGKLAAIIHGSTEATFYVLAVYFRQRQHQQDPLRTGLRPDRRRRRTVGGDRRRVSVLPLNRHRSAKANRPQILLARRTLNKVAEEPLREGGY